jgi:hypothetical protein
MRELFDDPRIKDSIDGALKDADLLAREVEKLLEAFERVVKEIRSGDGQENRHNRDHF